MSTPYQPSGSEPQWGQQPGPYGASGPQQPGSYGEQPGTLGPQSGPFGEQAGGPGQAYGSQTGPAYGSQPAGQYGSQPGQAYGSQPGQTYGSQPGPYGAPQAAGPAGYGQPGYGQAGYGQAPVKEKKPGAGIIGPLTLRDILLLVGALFALVGLVTPVLGFDFSSSYLDNHRTWVWNWNGLAMMWLFLGMLTILAAGILTLLNKVVRGFPQRIGSLSPDQLIAVLTAVGFATNFLILVTTAQNFHVGGWFAFLGSLIAFFAGVFTMIPFLGSEFAARAEAPAHPKARPVTRGTAANAGAQSYGSAPQAYGQPGQQAHGQQSIGRHGEQAPGFGALGHSGAGDQYGSGPAGNQYGSGPVGQQYGSGPQGYGTDQQYGSGPAGDQYGSGPAGQQYGAGSQGYGQQDLGQQYGSGPQGASAPASSDTAPGLGAVSGAGAVGAGAAAAAAGSGASDSDGPVQQVSGEEQTYLGRRSADAPAHAQNEPTQAFMSGGFSRDAEAGSDAPAFGTGSTAAGEADARSGIDGSAPEADHAPDSAPEPDSSAAGTDARTDGDRAAGAPTAPDLAVVGSSDDSAGDTPTADAVTTDTSVTDTPAADTSVTDTSSTDTSNADTSNVDSTAPDSAAADSQLGDERTVSGAEAESTVMLSAADLQSARGENDTPAESTSGDPASAPSSGEGTSADASTSTAAPASADGGTARQGWEKPGAPEQAQRDAAEEPTQWFKAFDYSEKGFTRIEDTDAAAVDSPAAPAGGDQAQQSQYGYQDHAGQDQTQQGQAQPAQQAFWFAVPEPRDAVDPTTGFSAFTVTPGEWFLALSDNGGEFTVRNTDGREGLLRNTEGIQRG